MRKGIPILLFFMLFSTFAWAQIDTEFWFVAPEIAASHGDNPVYMRISTLDDTAEVTLRMPADLSFAPINQTILPNTTYSINLTPWLSTIENQPADQVLKKGLLLTSDHDVTAYYECAHTNNPGIFGMKGKNALGTEFYIVSQNNYRNVHGRESFDIVATEDNTTVTITPADDITGHLSGDTFTVTLMKGETYSARAVSALASRTLAGSHITSDKPIAVTWQDDSIETGGYDIVCDQTIPVNLLGTEYIAIKGFADNVPPLNDDERVYILAIQDSTIVTIDGTIVDTLMTAEFYNHPMPTTSNTALIQLTYPSYVLHLSGHPSECGASVLPQDSCTGSRNVGFARTNNNEFGLLILTRNGNQNSFLLNGGTGVITAADFNPVPGTSDTWVYYRETSLTTAEVPVGANLLQNTMGTFHLGVVHKTGASSEYGYFSNFASLYLGADASMCPADSLILDGGAYMNSYEWHHNIGGVWTLVGTNRFYTVHDTGYFACMTNGDFCTLMDTLHVVYYPNATVTLGADRTICEGTTTTFDPGLYVSYEWSTGETTPQITTGLGGEYWVKVTNNNNCIAFDTVVLLIDSLPQPDHLIGGPDAVCQGQTAVLFDADTLSFAESYVWTLPPGFTGSSDSSSILVDISTSAVTGQISIKGLNACGESPEVTRTVIVNPLPGPAPGITGPDAVCPGVTGIMFVAAPVAEATSYNWVLPAGATLASGTGNDTILVDFSLAAASGNIEVNGVNACGSGSSVSFAVTIKPFPGTPGSITGANPVCPGQTGALYSVAPIADATSTVWTYSGSGVSMTNNFFQNIINYSVTATSGNLTVTGHNECGDGPVSAAMAITVNPRPDVSLQICRNIVTRDAKPFALKGGIPLNGTWTGDGVTGGVFNPALVPLVTDSATITYTYTNVYGCPNSAVKKIKVYPVQPFTCGGVLTDVRDQQSYPTVQIGTQCWMAVGLNYGAAIPTALLQRDNCVPEKYCYGDNPANCTTEGGLYAWDELMEYEAVAGTQGICPPRWHVPTESEWTQLFNMYTSNGFAGSPLKYTGYSGFDALFTGARAHNRSDIFRGFATLLWSSEPRGPYKAWAHGMNEYNPSVSFYPAQRSNAFGVRCIQDL